MCRVNGAIEAQTPSADAWVQRLSYLSDIFDMLNKYNLKLQGRDTHILLFSDTLRSLVSKIENWRLKTSEGHVIMFKNLSAVMNKSQMQLDPLLQNEIVEHLHFLESEFKLYFPSLNQEQETLVRNPFRADLEISTIPNNVSDNVCT